MCSRVAWKRSNKRKKVEKGLADMRRFMLMAEWARAAAAGDAEKLAAVCAVIDSEVDTHHLPQVQGQLKSILKQDMPAEVLV